MAFNNIPANTNFVGSAAEGYISEALFSKKTVDEALVTIMTNVKYQKPVKKLTSDDLLQADSCDFVDQGTVSLTERMLTPVPIKVNQELCYTDLESHWESENMRAGANNSDLADLQSFLISYMIRRVGQNVDQLVWSGDTGDLFEGFNKIVGDAAGTIDVTAGTLSASNILTEIAAVYDAIPPVIVNSSDLKIFIPYSAVQFYKRAVASSSGNANFTVTQDQELSYLGVPIIGVPLPNDRMIAAQSANLFMGTDLASDFNEITIVDMRQTDASDNIRFKMRMRAGVQIANPSEIVHYTA